MARPLDSIAQADADHKELQQLAETLGLKDQVDEPLYAADGLQGLVQSSAYEPGDARLSPGVLSPGRLSLPTSEDLLRTPPPSQLAIRPAMAPGSQAVVAAMRALQERVRELTHDNVGLAAEAGSLREQVSSLQAAAQRGAAAKAEREEAFRSAGQAAADAARVQAEQAREGRGLTTLVVTLYHSRSQNPIPVPRPRPQLYIHTGCASPSAWP